MAQDDLVSIHIHTHTESSRLGTQMFGAGGEQLLNFWFMYKIFVFFWGAGTCREMVGVAKAFL